MLCQKLFHDLIEERIAIAFIDIITCAQQLRFTQGNIRPLYKVKHIQSDHNLLPRMNDQLYVWRSYSNLSRKRYHLNQTITCHSSFYIGITWYKELQSRLISSCVEIKILENRCHINCNSLWKHYQLKAGRICARTAIKSPNSDTLQKGMQFLCLWPIEFDIYIFPRNRGR